MKNVLKKVLVVVTLLLMLVTGYVSLSLVLASSKGAPVSFMGKQYYVNQSNVVYYVEKSAVDYFQTGDTILCKVGRGNDKNATLVVLTAINKINSQYEFTVRAGDGENYIMYPDDIYGEAQVAPDTVLNTLLKLIVSTPFIMYGFTLFAVVLFILSMVLNRKKPVNLFEEHEQREKKESRIGDAAQQEEIRKEPPFVLSPTEELDVHTEQLVVEEKSGESQNESVVFATNEQREKGAPLYTAALKTDGKSREEAISTEELLLPVKDKLGKIQVAKKDDSGITYGEFVQQVGVKQEYLEKLEKLEKERINEQKIRAMQQETAPQKRENTVKSTVKKADSQRAGMAPAQKAPKKPVKKTDEQAKEMLDFIDSLLDK